MEAGREIRERRLLALLRTEGMGHERMLEAALASGRGGAFTPDFHEDPALNWGRVEQDLVRLEAAGARVVGAGDPSMPARLRAISDCPPALLVRGDPALLGAPQIAIVGSRRATPAGVRIAARIAGELTECGLVVTSGLAQGIDAAAHRGALDAGGRTIAVLGSSLDRIYPAVHRGLAERIAASGALVSEFPFGTPARPWHFPRRNRVISGLSLGVLVVEAAIRSGSLITARLGAEQGREVFAVPGSILNPLTGGCHRLIRDGAKLVEGVEDVLEELPGAELERLAGNARSRKPDPPGIAATAVDPVASVPDRDEAAVLERFDYEPTSAEALMDRTGLTPAQVYPILLRLELGGSIRVDAAGRYVRVR